jgi:hypothetical protein
MRPIDEAQCMIMGSRKIQEILARCTLLLSVCTYVFTLADTLSGTL